MATAEDSDPDTESDDPPSREELRVRLESQSTQLDELRSTLEDEQDRREDLEARLAAKDERIDALEARLDELDARTDLLSVIEDVDEMTGKQRSVTLIQHLKRAAENRRDGEPTRASVNRDEAERALQYPDVDRTTIFSDMRRAERLVDDDDVLWYDSDSGGNTRLYLDLELGALPGNVVGQQDSGGGG